MAAPLPVPANGQRRWGLTVRQRGHIIPGTGVGGGSALSLAATTMARMPLPAMTGPRWRSAAETFPVRLLEVGRLPPGFRCAC